MSPGSAYGGSEPFVFISYAHADRDKVYPEIEWMQQNGLHVWWDEGISPGAEWTDTLAERIQNCTHFIYFLTPASIESEHCRRELNFAIEEEKEVLAVYLESTMLPRGLRLVLNNRQTIVDYADSGRERLAGALGTGEREQATPPVQPHQQRQRPGIATVGIAVLAIVAIATAYMQWDTTEPATPSVQPSQSQPRIAVIPFRDLTESPESDNFEEGLATDIRDRLSQLDTLTTVSDLAIQDELAAGHSPDSLDERLGVTHVVTGVIRGGADKLIVSLQLADLTDRSERALGSFEGSLDQPFELQHEIALEVARALQAQLSPAEESALTQDPTDNPAAYALFQKSLEIGGGTQVDSNRMAIALAEDVIAMDPNYVAAYGHLAWLHKWQHTLGVSGALEPAFTYANKAVELDPANANARFALGSVFDASGQTRAAIREFRQAVNLNDTIPHALQDLSWTLAATGQLEESLEMAIRAVELRPRNGNTRYHLTVPLVMLDPERTGRWLDVTLEELGTDPRNVGRILRMRMMLDLLNGDRERARSMATMAQTAGFETGFPEATRTGDFILLSLGEGLERTRRILESEQLLNPHQTSGTFPLYTSPTMLLGLTLEKSGDLEGARVLYADALSNLSELLGNDERSSSVIVLAAIYAALDQPAEAYEWLERAYDSGFRADRHLEIHPMFERIKEDEHFKDTLARMARDVERMRTNAERDGLLARVDELIEGKF